MDLGGLGVLHRDVQCDPLFSVHQQGSFMHHAKAFPGFEIVKYQLRSVL